MSEFGRNSPREMPVHFFYGSLRIDYASAVPANPEKQNCSICPRYWYMDTIFPCARCGSEFTFTAAEQRVWYEEYGFWIDSLPKYCLECRRELRELKAARQEYDEFIEEALESTDPEFIERVASIIDQLNELGEELSPRMNENRKRLARQLAKARPGTI